MPAQILKLIKETTSDLLLKLLVDGLEAQKILQIIQHARQEDGRVNYSLSLRLICLSEPEKYKEICSEMEKIELRDKEGLVVGHLLDELKMQLTMLELKG